MKPRPSPLPKPLEIKVARVARHDPRAVTESMNRVADAVDTRLDPALAAAARRVLEHTEW